MALVEIVMPKMGESVMEATVIGWLKNEGDTIEQDESLLEVATDKVDTEVPTTHGGVVKELLAKEGDVIEVGKAIAIIATDGDETAPAPTPNKEVVSEPVAVTNESAVAMTAEPESVAVAMQATSNGKSDRFYSPLVRNIAKQEQISIQELDTIPGSGMEGRVTKRDILNYIKTRGTGAPAPTKSAPATKHEAPAVVASSISGQDEIIEMDRMRKIIAERMVESKHVSAHVQSFVEADVTNVVKWRNKVKDQFQKQEGEKLTFTPIFMEAIVRALKDYPMMNISVDGSRIIKKKKINIGMAVALPSGNLIVPVIKNAEDLSLLGLTKQVNDLAARARDNKLTPDDLSDGTYTVSNVGSFGSLMGTPIILQPQVGILALGAIVKKPAVLETEDGDVIAIRQKMILSHSYDHRVVDGALGGMFVKRVAEYLEGWDMNRTS